MIESNNNYKLIEPVSFNFIKFNDDNQTISYTDCFEISLLRFLHSVFVKNVNGHHTVDTDRLGDFMLDTSECKQLLDFFTSNNKIEPQEIFYQDEKSDGYKLRTDWCVFLNKRSFFRYKKENKYELCASLGNLFTFFRVFLPKLYLDQPTDLDKLTRLGYKLSNQTQNIEIKLKSNTEEDKFQFYYTNDMEITIGNTKYNWHLYQYFENLNGTFGERITGHSELSLL
jgi:hypothetical protein